jgi:hypothetical protein
MLQGIQYVTDLAGKPIAVQIDLRKHRGLWEDFCDVMVAQSRKAEPHSDWEDVKKRLKKPKRK